MLFGLVKRAGESVAVDVREWMGTDYFAAAMAAGIGLFVEEATNAFAQSKLNLTDWKLTAYKTIHRLLFSALYYFGFRKFGKPLLGLAASVMPVAMIFIDAVSSLLKVNNPQEAGLRLAERFSGIARVSAGTASVAAVAPVAVSVAPATTSAGAPAAGASVVGEVFKV